jgi:hypothetical protein
MLPSLPTISASFLLICNPKRGRRPYGRVDDSIEMMQPNEWIGTTSPHTDAKPIDK